jgi:hypothetical protein
MISTSGQKIWKGKAVIINLPSGCSSISQMIRDGVSYSPVGAVTQVSSTGQYIWSATAADMEFTNAHLVFNVTGYEAFISTDTL